MIKDHIIYKIKYIYERNNNNYNIKFFKYSYYT